MVDPNSGVGRFVLDLDKHYKPYPMQAAYHGSSAKFRLLGGAAGPGKTLAELIEHMITCSEFSDLDEAKQVHTLLLRRTFPKLEQTVITRFREKIPKELYRDYNESKHVVTWLNGATTHFGAMQYEHDVWGYQGQWLLIDYDELTEFTFKQWNGISAWNRCPVSPYPRKGGATNPIGIGADWVHKLFVLHKPCDEMDKSQKAQYNPEDYAYFPCTYLDNPVYATDEAYIANLDSYQGPISRALKLGEWGIAGGYFQGAWDEAANVYQADSFQVQPWHTKWLSGDWGFEHWAAIYAHCMDDFGICRTFREYVTQHEPPEMLAESIAKHFPGNDWESFALSHDAFAQRTDPNTIAIRMGAVLRRHGLPTPLNAGMDRLGRGQIMYEKLQQRVKVGEVFNDAAGRTEPVLLPAWMISDSCIKLIEKIPLAPRDEKKPELIAEFNNDDPIHGAGHGLQWKFGNPPSRPREKMKMPPPFTFEQRAEKALSRFDKTFGKDPNENEWFPKA